MWRVPTVALALASPLAACQFDAPVDQQPIDARLFDAAPACVADTIVCDDAQGVYTECDATGAIVRQMTCPLGCAPDVEKCLDIDPHNGLAMYLDMVPDPPDVVLSGPATFDTVRGLLIDGGLDVAVPSFLTPRGLGANEPPIRVYVVNSLTVNGPLSSPPNDLRQYPIAIVSRGDILIRGPIDVSAQRDLAGPGGWPGSERRWWRTGRLESRRHRRRRWRQHPSRGAANRADRYRSRPLNQGWRRRGRQFDLRPGRARGRRRHQRSTGARRHQPSGHHRGLRGRDGPTGTGRRRGRGLRQRGRWWRRGRIDLATQPQRPHPAPRRRRHPRRTNRRSPASSQSPLTSKPQPPRPPARTPRRPSADVHPSVPHRSARGRRSRWCDPPACRAARTPTGCRRRCSATNR
jgi:hypothetical protein